VRGARCGYLVIPAKAGIQPFVIPAKAGIQPFVIPAKAGIQSSLLRGTDTSHHHSYAHQRWITATA
jgi:hypothetical protein